MLHSLGNVLNRNFYNMITIGTVVKVVSPGFVYSTYTEMFKRMGFENKKENEPILTSTGGDLINNHFKVFGILLHPLRNGVILCGIVDTNGKELLIDLRGLEPIAIKSGDTDPIKASVVSYNEYSNVLEKSDTPRQPYTPVIKPNIIKKGNGDFVVLFDHL